MISLRNNLLSGRALLAAAFVFISIASVAQVAIQKRENPMGFRENKGQVRDQNGLPGTGILYTAAFPGMKLILTKGGFSYETSMSVSPVSLSPEQPEGKYFHGGHKNIHLQIHRIDVEFMDENPSVQLFPEDKSRDYVNYYTAQNPQGTRNVYAYRRVVYKNVYKNIDFVFTADDSRSVEYSFMVYPGGNAADIRMKYAGFSDAGITGEGNLRLSTSLGGVVESAPMAYEKGNMKKIPVNFSFSDGVLRFETGQYQSSQTLVIDPAISWSTYFGGDNGGNGDGMGVDASNNIYTGGYTSSTINIATSGVYQTTLEGWMDAFVTKFDASGTRLWSTYLGQAGAYTYAKCLAVSPGGDVVVAGNTTDPSPSPVTITTAGAHQPAFGGWTYDGFIARFDNSGARIWSTYYGGWGDEEIYGVALDVNSNVIVTGTATTNSGNSGTSVIATSGVYQTAAGGANDAFIAKFTSAGVRSWGTFYGGTGNDAGFAIASYPDPSGNIAVTGRTTSTSAIASGGSYQPAFLTPPGYTSMAFAGKFNSSGARLWGTYYGACYNDVGNGVAIDAAGAVLIAGYTTSGGATNSAYYTAGAHQTAYGCCTDGFIAKLSSSGASRSWATYYGGTGLDYIWGLTLNATDVMVVGETQSPNGTNVIATAGAYQTALGSAGVSDAFAASFNASSGVRNCGSYYGGSSSDVGYDIAVDATGKFIIGGKTQSSSNIATAGAYQVTLSGVEDAFVAQFCSTCNGSCAALPLELISFTGKNTGDENLLEWTTAPGAGNDYFDVERKIGDHGNWETAGSVKALENTGTPGRYHYTDSRFPHDSGFIIYRLRMVEHQGTYTYSSAIAINLSLRAASVYPSPAGNTLTVDAGGYNEVFIYDIFGRAVLKTDTQGTAPTLLSINMLPAGTYFLKLGRKGDGDFSRYLKFMKE